MRSRVIKQCFYCVKRVVVSELPGERKRETGHRSLPAEKGGVESGKKKEKRELNTRQQRLLEKEGGERQCRSKEEQGGNRKMKIEKKEGLQ